MWSGLVPEAKLKELVKGWLAEDCPSFDPAGALVSGKPARAQIKMKVSGVLCGKPFVNAIFKELGCSIRWMAEEGQALNPVFIVAEIEGEAQSLLLGERVALNILARASAMATKARRLSNLLKDTGIRLAGTRKTTPGFRIVEKYALLVGGCDPHRFDLSSMVMLKDNHVDLCGGNIQDAVAKTKSLCSYSQRIQVECRSLEDAMAALEAGADAVMLDNAGVDLSCAWAEQIRKAYPKTIIEASGGIDENAIMQYSRRSASVDVISMGSLTQDMQHIDFSLCII